ncbi:MAG: hypothetical protein ABIQ78_02235 [Dokdonella sp.]
MHNHFISALICAASLLGVSVPSHAHAQATPEFSIDSYVISAGANRSFNTCFVLTGTLGQAAPGYSSGGVYYLLSGFWSFVPITERDEIFFNGFEGCSP